MLDIKLTLCSFEIAINLPARLTHTQGAVMELAAAFLALLLVNFAVAQEITISAAPSQPELSTANSLAASTTALPPVSNNRTSYRLPENVRPEHYKLEIKTYLEGENSRFEGHVRIRIKSDENTPEIVLHSKGLDLNTDAVMVTEIATGRNLGVAAHEFDNENEFYIIKLDDELQSGQKYLIDIIYTANLTSNLAGYYRSSYKDKATGQTKWIALTQFEATDARRAFPCFDEPAMKAVFQVNLIRQKGFSSISNMPLAKSVELDDDWYRDEFEESVRMSTYLLAFVVSDFAYLESAPGNTTFRVWARPDAIEQARYSLEIGPKLLEFYESYFDVAYPLPKMDMIALPDFSAGAMENWGLVTYRETNMLYEKGVSSETSKEYIASVVAHEIAHQWFGNLVTMKWWDDIWLNEGFATYAEQLGLTHIMPQWNSKDIDSMNFFLQVLSEDSLKSSHPVSNNIQHPNEIWQLFDTISYLKGSLILRMLNNVLGEGTFKSGVSRYLKANKYSNAIQDVLWNSLEEKAQLDSANELTDVASERGTVKEIMDSWTLQTGYPVIHVTRNYDEGTADLSQTRFVIDWLGRSNAESLWWVPISYTDPSKALLGISTKPHFWMHTSNATITQDLPEKNQWFLLNVNASVPCRVNYDLKNWELLTTALRNGNIDGSIPVLNRVQIVDDAFNLARAGLLDYSTALNLLSYLHKEKEYLPWKAALSNLAFFSAMTIRGEGFGPFVTFVRTLLTPEYSALHEPFEANLTGYSLPQIKQRAQVLKWACSLSVLDCEDKANSLFKSWLDQSEDPDVVNPIPVELRSVVYCTAVKSGGARIWDFVWKRALGANVVSEKNRLMSALGCTKEIWLLHRYLDMSLNESTGIRKQDASLVFQAVARSAGGFYVAREFLFSRIKNIHNLFSHDLTRVGGYIITVSRFMTTEHDLEQLRTFAKLNEEYLRPTQYAVKQAIENVELNVQWHSRYYQTVIDWLSKYANESFFA